MATPEPLPSLERFPVAEPPAPAEQAVAAIARLLDALAAGFAAAVRNTKPVLLKPLACSSSRPRRRCARSCSRRPCRRS